MALVVIDRDPGPTDLKAVRASIGAELRTIHSGVLREEIPEEIAELLKQLDQQPRQLDQEKDSDSP
jgi:Anti-sigma factor NepR